MSENVFNQINPATEPETTETNNVNNTTATATIPTNTTAPVAILISNVRKPFLADSEGEDKPDSTALELCLVKVASRRMMTVYHEDTGKRVTIPYVDGYKMFDVMPDGGKISNITKGTETRTYSPYVRVELTDLLRCLKDGLGLDLENGFEYTERHKVRKPKAQDEVKTDQSSEG